MAVMDVCKGLLTCVCWGCTVSSWQTVPVTSILRFYPYSVNHTVHIKTGFFLTIKLPQKLTRSPEVLHFRTHILVCRENLTGSGVPGYLRCCLIWYSTIYFYPYFFHISFLVFPRSFPSCNATSDLFVFDSISLLLRDWKYTKISSFPLFVVNVIYSFNCLFNILKVFHQFNLIPLR